MDLERMPIRQLREAALQMHAYTKRKEAEARELAALALDRSRQIQELRLERTRLEAFYWRFASQVGDALSVVPVDSATNPNDVEWKAYCEKILADLPAVKLSLQR